MTMRGPPVTGASATASLLTESVVSVVSPLDSDSPPLAAWRISAARLASVASGTHTLCPLPIRLRANFTAFSAISFGTGLPFGIMSSFIISTSRGVRVGTRDGMSMSFPLTLTPMEYSVATLFDPSGIVISNGPSHPSPLNDPSSRRPYLPSRMYSASFLSQLSTRLYAFTFRSSCPTSVTLTPNAPAKPFATARTPPAINAAEFPWGAMFAH